MDIKGYIHDFIPGNKSKRTRKGRYSGGISVYYKSELKNHITVLEKQQCGIIWLKLCSELFPFEDDVYICNIYIPPNLSTVLKTSDIDMYDQLETGIIKYNNLGRVFVTGDFNSRTSDSIDYLIFDKYLDHNLEFMNSADIPLRTSKDRISDYNGLKLLNLCQCTGLVIANGRLHGDQNIGKFTFCSHMGQSIVDYLLLNFSDFEIISYFDILEFNEFSDHAPITFQFNLKHQETQTFDTTQNEIFINRKIVWDDSKTDLFHTQLMNNNEAFSRLISDVRTEPIDHVVQDFTRLLHDNAFDVFGKTCSSKSRPTHHVNANNEWFDNNCQNAKQEFKTARNNFNRMKTDETRINFTRARTKYNRVKRKAKAKFKIKEGQRINNLAKKQPRKFWKNIKSTFKKSSENSTSLTVEDLHDHFKSVFGEEPAENDFNENIFNQTEFNEDLDVSFTESELRKVIFSLNNNKSPGIDSLTSEILKAAYDFISPFLLSLYNRMFNSGEYPRAWGEGIISPIFKKGDINDANNYRGITLINVLAKIYSQLLLNRLTDWSEKYEKISRNQFGFQKGKSVVDCVFILHAVISKVMNTGQKLYCVFIDYEKCFDKIDRTYLWQKLLAENISSKLVTAIKSMYTTVKSCVKYNSTYSNFFDSSIGLKQGDPSSPLLFMFFVNDIIENINTDLQNIFSINELKLFLILFADDQVLFATSPDTLQSLLTDLENYCRLWGLKINTSKTKAMIFEKGRRTHYDFHIYDTVIELVDSFKYLGITLFKNGNWYRTQKCISQHASFALYNLFKILKNIELPIAQKIKLFDTLVSPILNFGSELWGTHSATDIELVHTKFLRFLLGVKKSTNLAALYGELGRIPLSVYRKVHMIKYWIKILQQNETSLLKNIYIMLKTDTDLNNNYNGQNWASQIKLILQEHGFEYVWRQQSEIEIPYHSIRQRIIDTYQQSWYSEINNSSRLHSYCIFKHNFELEKYLTLNLDQKYKIALTRFRTSSHSLFIESGRYQNLQREQRVCQSCNMNKVEDEFHFLLVCPHYRDLRQKNFKPYFCHWPTLRKFETLLSMTSVTSLRNLSKFIYFADKKRIEVV